MFVVVFFNIFTGKDESRWLVPKAISFGPKDFLED